MLRHYLQWKSLPKRKPLLTFANGGEDLELALRLATLSVAPSSAPYSEAKKRVKGHVAIKDFGTPSYASSGLRAKSQRELMWTRVSCVFSFLAVLIAMSRLSCAEDLFMPTTVHITSSPSTTV